MTQLMNSKKLLLHSQIISYDFTMGTIAAKHTHLLLIF
jgi:hypothetical protein